MRKVISNVLVLVLLGFFTVAAAQLPPDIIADSYLLQVEQAIRDGDHAGARAGINKIIDLQREHELDLPDEFHFRYAKAADAADLPEPALESIVKYLAAAGREGQHYVEALELMNKVQAAIEERPEAAPGQPATTQAAIDVGDDSNILANNSESLGDSSSSQDGVAAVSCQGWNTEEYFETATLEEVTACLDAGADLKARDDNGWTPLHWAAGVNENPAVIEALLAAGADLKARDEYGGTPLQNAAGINENPAVIEALLAAGADPKARNVSGDTPLHFAARFNNPAIAQALLKAGADPKAEDALGETPLQNAASNRNPAVRAILLQDDDSMPLHYAATNSDNPAEIEALLAAGADPGKEGDGGNTPLHYAVTNSDNPAVIEALLAAGADLEVRNDEGRMPLHLAAAGNGNPAVVEALLAAGADLEEEEDVGMFSRHQMADEGRTPLHWAVQSNNLAVIETLLAAGADLEARDYFNSTPLHRAARYRSNPAVIETLLATGANLEAEIDPGIGASYFNYFARSTPLHEAASFGSLAVVEALLAAGADPRKEDDDDHTPLHRAARYNRNPAMIEALLAAGLDLEARDDEGRTPLYLAAQYNRNPAVIEAFLAAGANLEARNEDGDSPLQIATEENDNAAVREVLLAAGAGQIERQRAAERARREAESGPSFLDFAVGAIGATAITVAGGGTEEAVEAGTVFAESVMTGQQPVGNSGGSGSPDVIGSAGNTGVTAGGGSCLIPGYPTPANPQTLGLASCPASVDFQRRAFAFQAAGAQCAIATGSSSTPEQINARRQEIKAACDRLDALQSPDIPTCQCPAGLRP